MPRLRSLALRLLMLSLGALAVRAGVGVQDEGFTTALAERTFDEVWETVHEHHFDPAFNGVDWDEVRRELRPAASAAHDTAALREVIETMLARLDQSHFTLIPAEALQTPAGAQDGVPDARAGGPGFELRALEGRAFVRAVRPEGPAARAGVRTGWELLGIRASSCVELVEAAPLAAGGERDTLFVWRTLTKATLGSIGEEVLYRFEDGAGGSHEATLVLERRDVVAYQLMSTLPVYDLRFESGVHERGGKRIFWVRFNNWFRPMRDELEAVWSELAACDGFVLDLRGNTGGNGGLVGPMAGRFLQERTVLGTQHMRDRDVDYVARPAGRIFDGPFAILTDATTGSTSEVFAGGLQSVGRARLFGERTAGAVLPARTKRLPNGDALLYAIGDFRTAQGKLLEGAGVVPDELVPVRRVDLLHGLDAPLERALGWIVDESE